MKTTLPKLKKLLIPIINNSKYEIDIALQEGGHRYVARIFWPYSTYPALGYDNPEKERRGVYNGKMCIEYTLDAVDGGPESWELPDEYYGAIAAGLSSYLKFLRSQEPDDYVNIRIYRADRERLGDRMKYGDNFADAIRALLDATEP